jgi:hypothetical protein
MSSILSELAVRVRVAQWITDEASITVAHNLRFDTSSLMVVGAMNDFSAMEAIAKELEVTIISGAAPPRGRLPTHIIKVQGARAYSLLSLLSKELTGLKALEGRVALDFFPPSGIVKGKLTTDVFMATAWKQFARESVEVWNSKRRKKLSPLEIEDMIEAWIVNRAARARRGLIRDNRVRPHQPSTSATPLPSRPSPRT